jgi:hypothetical protein
VERVGKEPNHTTTRKPGPLSIIQCSLAALLKVVIFEKNLKPWARATVYLELNFFTNRS